MGDPFGRRVGHRLGEIVRSRAHRAMGGDGGDSRGGSGSGRRDLGGEGDDGGEIGCGCVGRVAAVLLLLLGWWWPIDVGSRWPRMVSWVVVRWSVLKIEILKRRETDIGWEVAMSHWRWKERTEENRILI